jgi:hypothetical protein
MGSRPKTPKERPGYLSYLLRLWQVHTERVGPQAGGTVWRASLESSLTGQRQGFASLDELFEFLAWQTDRVAGAAETQDLGDTDSYL